MPKTLNSNYPESSPLICWETWQEAKLFSTPYKNQLQSWQGFHSQDRKCTMTCAMMLRSATSWADPRSPGLTLTFDICWSPVRNILSVLICKGFCWLKSKVVNVGNDERCICVQPVLASQLTFTDHINHIILKWKQILLHANKNVPQNWGGIEWIKFKIGPQKGAIKSPSDLRGINRPP